MKISPRPFKGSRFTKMAFDRWFNGGRKIRQMQDKACMIRSRSITFAHVVRRNKLYGRNR